MRLFSTDPNVPGVFAVGQVATGVFALGQMSLGVVAVGQLARGVFSVGQGAIGVVSVGQGAVGLWYATGMVGVAGQRGYGLVAHLLPRVVTEPAPDLPPASPISDLLEEQLDRAWVATRLARGSGGGPKIEVDGDAPIDLTLVESKLAEGLARGCDRAHLRVRAESIVDASGYREADKRISLHADDAIVHASKLPSHLAYGTIPRGAPVGPASSTAIGVRSVLWCFLLVFYLLIVMWPLASSLLGIEIAIPFLMEPG